MTSNNQKKYQTKNPLKLFFLKKFLIEIRGIVSGEEFESMLDAGCGEGLTLNILNQAVDLNSKKVKGFDFSEKSLVEARKNFPSGEFFVENIENIKSKEKFDLVICLEVLEHLRNPRAALINLKSLTSKRIVISVPWEPFFSLGNFLSGKNLIRLGNDIEHINNWSKKGIVELISDYFLIKKVKISFPWVIIVGVRK